MSNQSPTTPNDALNPLIEEAKRIEEDAIFSAKGHFEAAAGWDSWHLWIGIPTTVLAAAASIAAFSDAKLGQVQPDGIHYMNIVAGCLALFVAISSALFTFLNPKERSAQHLQAGNAFKALNNDARIFHQIDCVQQNPLADLTQALRKLSDRRNELGGRTRRRDH